MKIKRLVILTLALSIIFASTIYADSLWGNYQGFSKVKVNINDKELTFSSNEVPALSINGTTMLPLRKVAESLQAIVNWDNDNMTANVYKPDVHMFLAESVDNDYSTIHTPFGKVSQGKTSSFVVFVQVDNLVTYTSGFRITLETPSGNVADSKEVDLKNSQEYFWYTSLFKSEKFSEKGAYIVKFSFKNNDGNYIVVSQKTIVSE